ncbi:MAG: hypothetical protein HOV92_12775 [Streptomyces sp.]|nr:hypothetical protein [Streptomyces sp.]
MSDLYGAIARQEWELVDTLRAAHPNAWQELLDGGLISDEKHPVVRDPQKALRQMVSRELAEARRRIDFVAILPDLSRDLIREYQQVQLRAGGSSVYLADPVEVNARIQDAVTDARREILAAQPGGPRKRELLEMAVDRDAAALDRGVEMRTLYRDTVRDHALTAEYARTMSTRGSGRPARYRTLVGGFERMLIVDREKAFVSDHVVAGSPPHSAWLVTDPAAVAVLARVFDSEWYRGQPWAGELRSTWGGLERREAGPGGVRTNRLEREVMRLLCTDMPQAQIASKVGLSKRKLEEVIAGVKELWGVRTLNEIIYHFALSPDHSVEDEALHAADPATTASAA